MTDTNLRFLAPSSVIEPSFWEELYNRKLNIYKLNSDDQLIYTQFSSSDGWKFSKESYDKSNKSSYNRNVGNGGSLISITGLLVNVNTVDVSNYFIYVCILFSNLYLFNRNLKILIKKNY
jgi:hypothetical protein